jgi:hypothetical protein
VGRKIRWDVSLQNSARRHARLSARRGRSKAPASWEEEARCRRSQRRGPRIASCTWRESAMPSDGTTFRFPTSRASTHFSNQHRLASARRGGREAGNTNDCTHWMATASRQRARRTASRAAGKSRGWISCVASFSELQRQTSTDGASGESCSRVVRAKRRGRMGQKLALKPVKKVKSKKRCYVAIRNSICQ